MKERRENPAKEREGKIHHHFPHMRVRVSAIEAENCRPEAVTENMK